MNKRSRRQWFHRAVALPLSLGLAAVWVVGSPAHRVAADAPGGCPGGFGSGFSCQGYGLTVGLSGGATRWAGSYKNDDDPTAAERWVVGTCVQDTSGHPGAGMGPNTVVALGAYAPPGQTTVPAHPELVDELGIARWLLEPTVPMTVPGSTSYAIAGVSHTLNEWWAGMWLLGHFVVGDTRSDGSGPLVVDSSWASGATSSPVTNQAAHDLLAVAQSIPLPWTSDTLLDPLGPFGPTVTVTVTAANGAPVGSAPTYFDPGAPTTPNVSYNGVAGQSGQPRQLVGATEWLTGAVAFPVTFGPGSVKRVRTVSTVPGPEALIYQQLGGQDLVVTWGEDFEASMDEVAATIDISTLASDPSDGDHVLPWWGGPAFDVVAYTGAEVGATYTVEGELMLRNGDGSTTATGVTGAITFAAPTETGEVTIVFDVPVGLAGADLVVFERMYDALGDLVAEHTAAADAQQFLTLEAGPTADVHLRKTVATDDFSFFNAQRAAPPGYEPAVAPGLPWAGSFDDAAADAGDGTPVIAAGSAIHFRYEVWLDGASSPTAGVVFAAGTPAGLVRDDNGTPADPADDTNPVFAGGDDGDHVLEPTEVWTFVAVHARTAAAGESYRNYAQIPAGTVIDRRQPAAPTGLFSTPRRDPAGYQVPAITTAATDASDLDKVLGPQGGSVHDAVEYSNLVAGVEHVVAGELMVRHADGSVMPSGITASTTFTPAVPDGSFTVTFTVPAGFAGATLVAFEQVSVNGALVATHEDADDQGQTVRAEEVSADVHLRKLVSGDGIRWVNAQADAPPAYDPTTAPPVPASGSHDDQLADAGDGLPVLAAGTRVDFRYEVWLDAASTGVVRWAGGPAGVVVDDNGTATPSDDVHPTYLSGDDGDGLLEAGEVWRYAAAELRTASAGEEHRNYASILAGDVVEPAAPARMTGLSSTPRRDPAGYVVPLITTAVMNPVDGSRALGATGGEVVDTVTYEHLVPGVPVVVNGQVMALDANGSVRPAGVSATTTFVPATPSGSVAVSFQVPPNAAEGEYVVYEDLLVGSGTIATHHDPAALAQRFVKRSDITVTTQTCAPQVTTPVGSSVGRTCDRVTVTGDPGDVVIGTSTAYPWVEGSRRCDAPGATVAWQVTVGADGSGFVQSPDVEVPAGADWEWIETAHTADGRTFGRNCLSAPREQSESFAMRRGGGGGDGCCLPSAGWDLSVPMAAAAGTLLLGGVMAFVVPRSVGLRRGRVAWRAERRRVG